jgi:Domain of unknown function (DUF4440)
MRKFKFVCFAVAIAISSFVLGQQTSKQNNSALEKELWDVETQQWLNNKLPWEQARPIRFASWTDQFFEIYPNGEVHFKADMMASQSAAPAPAPGNGAFPEDFKLRAVYGNFALATDTTRLKGGSLDGVYRGLRMFVKENGKWRVAGAMFAPLAGK